MNFIQNESSGNDVIGLEESEGMNAYQQANFLQVVKSTSSDMHFDPLFNTHNTLPSQNYSLIWQPNNDQNLLPLMQEIQAPENTQPQIQTSTTIKQKIIRKQKIKKRSDYDKNICGYITKRVIRQFLGSTYNKQIWELIQKYSGDFDECKAYYRKKVQFITGPSHLPTLFLMQAGQPAQVESSKKIFGDFYNWFLKQRYLRYLLLEGKMTNKLAYIQYKNNHLFKFATHQIKIEEESNHNSPWLSSQKQQSNRDQIQLIKEID